MMPNVQTSGEVMDAIRKLLQEMMILLSFIFWAWLYE